MSQQLTLRAEELIEMQRGWRQNPISFMSEVLGSKLWSKQEEIVKSVFENRYTAVKSGNGNGKSYVIANIVLNWMMAYGPMAKVVTTSATYQQVEKILWSEIARAYKASKLPLGGRLKKVALEYSEDWFSIGISTDDEQRFQGFHSPNLLLIYDEAGGVRPQIWNAGRGIITASNNHQLVVGNPLSPTGDFFNCFTPDSKWNQITMSCLDNPNYKAKCEVFPGLSSYEWVEEQRKEWGEDSALWYSKVLGQFPVEAANTLIPLTWIEQARTRIIKSELFGQTSFVPWRNNDKQDGNPAANLAIGCDVARFGSCDTVISIFDGYKLLKQKIFKKRSTTEVAGFIIETLREYDNMQLPVAVDDTGVGGGVTDILREQGYNVMGVVLRSIAEEHDKFFDLRTEIFWDLRERFNKGMISLPDPEDNKRCYDKLANQLVGLTYEMDKRGRIKVTAKESIIKAGLESPDRADSLALAVYASKGLRQKGSGVNSNKFKKFFAGGRGGY